jgi:CheY-like chemotaxis protein
LNPNSDEVPLSFSPFPLEKSIDAAEKDTWIVLVEDNPADVALVREAFYEGGLEYNLTVLSDGEKALQLIERLDRERKTCPDLLLLDIGLPKKGGFEVLERMRASTQCARVPVVILTSSNAQEDQDTAAKLGVTLYIRKPDRLDDFIQLGSVFKQILTTAKTSNVDGSAQEKDEGSGA